MAYQPAVYRTSGGDEQVVESSGNIAVHSGGAITFAAGATLTLAGQVITSTGALTANSVATTGGISGSSGTFTADLALTSGISASTGVFTGGVQLSSTLTAIHGTFSSSVTVGGNIAMTSGLNATTGTFTGDVTVASNVAVTSGLSALRFVNNTIAAASSGSTGFVSYGITQLWSCGVTTGHVFTMPAAASAGVEKWLLCIASTTTAPAVVVAAGTLIDGSANVTFSTGSIAYPQYIHLMAQNTTNWFVLGGSTGVTIA